MPELRRELEVNPQSVDARAMLALLLFQGGQAADASSYAKKAVEAAPSSALAQYAYGSILADSDPKEAAAHLEVAERRIPLTSTIMRYWLTYTRAWAETKTRAVSGKSPSGWRTRLIPTARISPTDADSSV